MAKDSFKFKQFTVKHGSCAMKVGTDGVLLGAWSNTEGVTRVLDIGTGSGLIALMIAQRSSAQITGLDIDKDAVKEAANNFNLSPWSDRLRSRLADFSTDYSSENGEKFDLIVSNPPYFENSLSAPDAKRARARHTETLSFESLFKGVSENLTLDGRFTMILPAECENRVEEIAGKFSLYPYLKCYVIPKPGAAPKRIMWEFRTSSIGYETITESLVVELERHHYSKEYINLTKEYYLKM
ncbi:MAG: tRNA1(Val) (adenine(37)-N6)-methyltransferase [Bacteroidales bacterium]